MASLEDDASAGRRSAPVEAGPTEHDAGAANIISATIGATVPTGFEPTAAEEVREKIGVDVLISKDRGRIYFPITTDKLFQVCSLNLRLTFAFCAVFFTWCVLEIQICSPVGPSPEVGG